MKMDKKLQLTITFLFLLIILTSCISIPTPLDYNSLSKSQVKAPSTSNNSPSGEPGKCYMKMTSPNGALEWYEIICGNEISKFVEIQQHLIALDYFIDPQEISSKTLGRSTQKALIEFQKKNGLAYGGLDEATIYLLITHSEFLLENKAE